MPDAWTGVLVGKMHNKGVTYDGLAAELGVSKAYVSMVLNGARKPANARQRFNDAFNRIIEKQAINDSDLPKA